MTVGNGAPLRVVAVGDTDSRIKWAWAAASMLAATRQPHLVVLRSPEAPSMEQLRDATGVDAVAPVWAPVSELHLVPEVIDADVLVVCATTRATAAVNGAVGQLFERNGRRPIVVTGYAGLIYENRYEGLMWRLGSDAICVNSVADAAEAEVLLTELDRSDERIICLGYPHFDRRRRRESTGRFRVTFAAQPDVPRRRREREMILSLLIEYAVRHPAHDVVIKLRTRPGERTTHPQPYDYRRLARRRSEPLPNNLSFEAGDMATCLDRTDLLVTVSSTAALEAMARDVPVAIVGDLGIAERYGNHAFVGSGCVRALADLDPGACGAPNAGWVAEHGVHHDGSGQFRQIVAELVAEGGPRFAPPLSLASAVAVKTIEPVRGRRVRALARGVARNLVNRIQGWASG